MSACLLDNDLVKQELCLGDKSKIFPYGLNSFQVCPKVPSVIVSDLWASVSLGEAPSMGVLCVLPCFAGIEPQSVGIHVSPLSMELMDHPVLDDLCWREMGPTSLSLCTVAHTSMQRRCQMSLPMSSPWLLLHKAGHHSAQGILLATQSWQLGLRTNGAHRGNYNLLYDVMAISSVFRNTALKFPKS